MNEIASPREPLRRTTLRDLAVFLKAEWCWIVIFVALGAIGQHLSPQNEVIKSIIASGADLTYPVIVEAYRPFVGQALVSLLVGIVTATFAAYVFTVLYLRQSQPTNSIAFSVRHFAHWLKKMVEKYLIATAPLFSALAVYTAVPGLGLPPSGNTGQLVLDILALLWGIYYTYVIFFLLLVSPMAVLHDEPELRKSYAMTKGRLFWICWELLLVFLVILAVYIPIAIVLPIAASLVSSPGLEQAVSDITGGLWQTIMVCMLSIYACIVYRALRLEKTPL